MVSSLRRAGVLITRVLRLVVSVRLRLKAAGGAALVKRTSSICSIIEEEEEGRELISTFSPPLPFI